MACWAPRSQTAVVLEATFGFLCLRWCISISSGYWWCYDPVVSENQFNLSIKSMLLPWLHYINDEMDRVQTIWPLLVSFFAQNKTLLKLFVICIWKEICMLDKKHREKQDTILRRTCRNAKGLYIEGKKKTPWLLVDFKSPRHVTMQKWKQGVNKREVHILAYFPFTASVSWSRYCARCFAATSRWDTIRTTFLLFAILAFHRQWQVRASAVEDANCFFGKDAVITGPKGVRGFIRFGKHHSLRYWIVTAALCAAQKLLTKPYDTGLFFQQQIL